MTEYEMPIDVPFEKRLEWLLEIMKGEEDEKRAENQGIEKEAGAAC